MYQFIASFLVAPSHCLYLLCIFVTLVKLSAVQSGEAHFDMSSMRDSLFRYSICILLFLLTLLLCVRSLHQNSATVHLQYS